MDLTLPALGEGADSGTVVNLFVKEGDQLAKDQPVLELENEKAVATIPSTASGTVSKIFVKTGDKLSVGQRILSLKESGADEKGPSTKAKEKTKAPAQKQEPSKGEEEREAEPEKAAEEEKEEEEDKKEEGVKPAAAPSIRKLARDLGIDLARVRGSESGGRIVLADLRAYIQRLQKLSPQPKAGAPAPEHAEKPAAEQIDFSKWGPVSKKPLSPLRQ